jgi:hypothetical protein
MAGIFGTTTDFESGIQTKGAEIGNAKSEQPNVMKGEFASAPIPLLNPSIANGMGAMVMYLKPLDASGAPPPSTFAIAGNSSFSALASLSRRAHQEIFRQLVYRASLPSHQQPYHVRSG